MTAESLGWRQPPLEGLTVVEIGGLAASYAGWLLANAGADVVKLETKLPESFSGSEDLEFVESARLALGDLVRRQACDDVSSWLADEKPYALVVDYTAFTAADRASLRGEIEALDSDVVVCVVEPGELASAPSSEDAAWSELVAMASSGFLSLGGYPDEEPSSVNGHLAAFAAGAHVAVALVAHLVGQERRTAPRGHAKIRVGATESLLPALETALQFWHSENVVRSRHGSVLEAGYGTFTCSDGFITMVAAGLGDFAWARFCAWVEALDGGVSFRDPKWLNRDFRRSSGGIQEFTETVEKVFKDRTRSELARSGQELRVPIAAVNTLAEVLANQQLSHRGAWVLNPGGQRLVGPYRASQRSAGETSKRSSGARPRPAPTSEGAGRAGPLSGLRVLDFTWVGAGPFTTRVLADLGADVVKVESGRRLDPLRNSPPFRDGLPGTDRSAYFANRNAGKRTISVDLKHPSAVDAILPLAESADVIINSFGSGVMERLGLGAQFFRDHNPDVVHVDMPLHGATGPFAKHIGFGGMINASGGYHALSRFDERAPCGTGTNFPDHVPNPLHTLFALLLGVLGQVRGEGGSDIEVSQFESGIAFLAPELTYAARNGTIGGSLNRLDHSFPRGVYSCASGSFVAIETTTATQWAALSSLMGAGQLDPTWTLEARRHVGELIQSVLETYCREREAADVERILQAAGVPCAVVRDASDVARVLLARDSGNIKLIESAGFGEVLYSCLPFTVNGVRYRPNKGAPRLGSDTAAVLDEWGGLSDADIQILDEKGVLQ